MLGEIRNSKLEIRNKLESSNGRLTKTEWQAPAFALRRARDAPDPTIALVRPDCGQTEVLRIDAREDYVADSRFNITVGARRSDVARPDGPRIWDELLQTASIERLCLHETDQFTYRNRSSCRPPGRIVARANLSFLRREDFAGLSENIAGQNLGVVEFASSSSNVTRRHDLRIACANGRVSRAFHPCSTGQGECSG